ncbi:MAG: M15 family metallopeptidase [Opitutales bacterium]
MTPADQTYADRIATLHRELGIPADYAVRRHLIRQPEADVTALVSIAAKPDGLPVRLLPETAAAWRRMAGAARQAGIELLPLSGFRSVERQATLIREKLGQGRTPESVLASLAAPGFSEHHTGRALDLGTPGSPELVEAFAGTPAYVWLNRHAAEFNFTLSYPRGNAHGIVFEPWHWCWKS